MYKVLLVDDERTILEGISSIIDWESEGTELIGTACNGVEALEFISIRQPDIVISDIMMPGLDGIQLIEKSKKHFPNIKWILLSGFSEFDYAQNAMQSGVKHYLLKPCNEKTIAHALRDLVKDLNYDKEKVLYVENIEGKLEGIDYNEKEQCLKELLTIKKIKKEDYLKDTLSINENVQVLVFYCKEYFDTDQYRVLKKIIDDILGNANYETYTIVGNDLIVLIKEHEEQQHLLYMIKKIQTSYAKAVNVEMTIVVSHACALSRVYQTYHESHRYLDQQFYRGTGSILTLSDDVKQQNNNAELYRYDSERLLHLLKSGSYEEVKLELSKIFTMIYDLKLKSSLTKSYLIQMFLYIMNKSLGNVKGDRTDYMEQIAGIEDLETLEQCFATLEDICWRMMHNTSKTDSYSSIVIKMIDIIQNNLENSYLSLHWIAKEQLFMNVDYLGKLFKKEVGYKFSTYVTNKRIERAVEIIEREKDIKVFELADKLGFGNNPQYFSQIFKRITGVTPSDIIKSG
ncbi:response regulator transcription factor [Paraliobacillus sediminis]|uniref:response regulator transcription factor n=1 Tax=Paraliobacillus sediminis TaxID=1885916 RepID=UPI000E3BB7F4|nr:response regulator [Paraliobacillus sediminis]